MSVNNDDIVKLVDMLPEETKQSAYDFLRFLTRHTRPDWDEISQMEPDDTPLSEEEKLQLKNKTEFMSWEDAMHELNLPADIKS